MNSEAKHYRERIRLQERLRLCLNTFEGIGDDVLPVTAAEVIEGDRRQPWEMIR